MLPNVSTQDKPLVCPKLQHNTKRWFSTRINTTDTPRSPQHNTNLWFNAVQTFGHSKLQRSANLWLAANCNTTQTSGQPQCTTQHRPLVLPKAQHNPLVCSKPQHNTLVCFKLQPSTNLWLVPSFKATQTSCMQYFFNTLQSSCSHYTSTKAQTSGSPQVSKQNIIFWFAPSFNTTQRNGNNQNWCESIY